MSPIPGWQIYVKKHAESGYYLFLTDIWAEIKLRQYKRNDPLGMVAFNKERRQMKGATLCKLTKKAALHSTNPI